MGTIIVWSILAIGLGVSLLALLYTIAKYDMHATFVENGGFKFVVKGETLEKILDNLDGHYVNVETHVVKERTFKRHAKERVRGVLEKILGIVWVSWVWPMKKLHTFEVVADKLKEDESLPVRQRLQTELRRETYLRARFPHPVFIPDVELGGDQWKIDIIIMLDILVVNPRVVVFDYKGKVLRQVDATIRTAVMNFCKEEKYTYPIFLREDKGAESPIAVRVLDLNRSTSPEPVNDGLRERFGIELRAVWLESMDLSPEQKTLDDAAKGVQEKSLKADARVQEARGEKAYQKAIREGVGEGMADQITRLISSGVSPERAAVIVQEQVRTSNLAGPDSKIKTYVEGGGRTMLTIPADEE
jgi:hypothetical protein